MEGNAWAGPVNLMKVLCAWCGKFIGGRGASLSHGICRRCFQDFFQVHFDFMESLPVLQMPKRGRRRSTAGRSVRQRSPLVQQSLFA